VRRTSVVFAAGFLFAIGLGLSGMTNANKVIGFLNIAGTWDPALAFVMVGAIGAHLASFKWITSRPSPLFADTFHIPTRKDISPRLLGGAAIFGAGWGLGGFCPGPAIVSLNTGAAPALVFVGTMLGGMLIFQLVHSAFNSSHQTPEVSQ
jgi:uncharacterized membrane protein YedE/YeeE